MGALGYSSLKPSLTKISESTDHGPYDVGVVAAMRNGEVLGSQTVLKSDHCPGCQNLSLPERVDGAPNFREVTGFPVYGVANPTVDGIRVVVQRIRSKGRLSVLWHNMREEPVIYINGRPFVLREVERPYKNMLETTTGTVIACLVKLRIDHGKPIKMQQDDTYHEHLDIGSSSGEESIGDNGPPISDLLKSVDGKEQHCTFGIDDILLLRKITRLFDNGIECREVLDAIIDRCSALQNIRQAVLQYRKVINQQHVEPRVKRVALNRGAEYLEPVRPHTGWYIPVCQLTGTWTANYRMVPSKSTVGDRFRLVLAEVGRKKKREKPSFPARCFFPIPLRDPSPVCDSFSQRGEKERGDVAYFGKARTAWYVPVRQLTDTWTGRYRATTFLPASPTRGRLFSLRR
ncbi:hypothetical protein BHM03_00053634 [Ensete ventricosum]|nr:hypothetical protein BHM03_00053634 [Ensete ventricosum]